jgi:long-chain fatty acid transport protein
MKKFFSLLLCTASISFASMIGFEALGEEQTAGGSTAIAGRGFAGNAKTGDAEGVSVLNPARQAFDTKVVLNLNFLLDVSTASRSNVDYTNANISMPSMNLSFPMGDFGTFGVALWQRYSSAMREKVHNEKENWNAEIEYQSSLYELVPTYAVRLPFFRAISLGASAHVVMGSFTRSLTLGPDTSEVAVEDRWATNDEDVSDYVNGDWEIKHHPAYFSFAAQYRGRMASYFFSVTTPYTLSNELKYNFRFSELDTLVPTRYTREIRVPARLATGVNYRFMKRHNVMMDMAWSAWNHDIENVAGSWNLSEVTKTQDDFNISVGYQRDGSDIFYDSYWDRITYRAGAWYKNWYIKDVSEIGGSIGAGFPLGRKGTMLDFAIQGGVRLADDDHNWNESFIGVRLGLVGVGNWGRTRGQ